MERLCGRFRGSNRLARARVFLYGIFRTASLSCAAFFRGRRLRTGVFGHGGVQFQANVLSSGNGRSISRGSVRREGKHRPHRPVEVREIGQTCERGGESGADEAVEGEFRRREAERCAQVRNFCRKASRFSSFHGDFCDKVRTFFLSVVLFRTINRAETLINGDENEPGSARMYIRGVKNW